MSKISQAIIMCGGKGTRISKITHDLIPKSLIIFNQKSFLEILINKISNLGIKKIILCTGYLSNHIEKFIGIYQKNNQDLKIIISCENSALGTAGSLKLASKFIDNNSSIILNGDTYVNYDLNKYINWHYVNGCEISIMLSFVFNSSNFGSVKLYKNKVLSFEEKKEKYFKFVYNGIFISQNKFLNQLELKFSNVEDTIFPDNLGSLYGFKSFSKFYDIGTLEGFVRAKKFLVF